MRKTIYTILSLFLFLNLMEAQERISVQLEEQPINSLFLEIEQQTPYRIFCNPEDTDSLFVTVHAMNEEPVQILETALKNTGLTLSVFNNHLFILKDRILLTSLPEGYFDRTVLVQAGDYDLADFSLTFNRRDQKATSENKVYEIGEASGQASGRVTLTGSVVDFKTGEPMVGVALFISEPLIATTTDGFGYYSIQLPPGRHELQIKGMGMKDTKRQILLHSGGKLDIELEEQVYTLREVTISSERIENVRSTNMGVERLKMKEIKNIPTAFGEADIIRVVMSLPGVKSVGEASSGFNVRGGATDQNLILFNDGVIYNPTHLFGFFSAFNPDVVKDMELYKSSIPSKYGGRISSVLDITSREGNKKEFQGSASLGLLTSRLTLEGPVFSEKTSFIVGGRTTYSDWILKKLPEKSGYKDGSAGFYDLNATVSHKFNEYNNLYVNGYYSRDRFSFNAEEKYAYQNANASIKWRHIFSPKLTSVYTAGYDHYDYNTIYTDNAASAYNLSFGIDQFFAKADFVWYANDKHTVDFGVNTLYYDLNPGKYLPEGEESIVVPDHMQKEKAAESAVYIGDRWEITPQLSVNAGIRYTMFNVLGPRSFNAYEEGSLPSLNTITDTVHAGSGSFQTYHGPEFRLSARYEFADGFSVKAGYNTMRQHIHKLSNTTIMSPTDTWKLSDANIKPQTGYQVAAGLYKNLWNNTMEASIEGYYKNMKNYLDYRSNAELIMNHHIETDVISTEGRAYGVEFMLKKTLGKLNG